MVLSYSINQLASFKKLKIIVFTRLLFFVIFSLFLVSCQIEAGQGKKAEEKEKLVDDEENEIITGKTYADDIDYDEYYSGTIKIYNNTELELCMQVFDDNGSRAVNREISPNSYYYISNIIHLQTWKNPKIEISPMSLEGFSSVENYQTISISDLYRSQSYVIEIYSENIDRLWFPLVKIVHEKDFINNKILIRVLNDTDSRIFFYNSYYCNKTGYTYSDTGATTSLNKNEYSRFYSLDYILACEDFFIKPAGLSPNPAKLISKVENCDVLKKYAINEKVKNADTNCIKILSKNYPVESGRYTCRFFKVDDNIYDVEYFFEVD